MGKKLIIDEIEHYLKPPLNSNSFTEIFIKILHWLGPEQMVSRITVKPDTLNEFTFSPIAERSGFFVLLTELRQSHLPEPKLLAQIHKNISQKFHHHLLIFISADRNSAMLSWAKHKTGANQEIRTCLYKNGTQSRAMAITLKELLIDLSESEFDEPHILHIIEKVHTAFVKENDVTETFNKLANQLRILIEKYSDLADMAKKDFDYKNCDKYNALANEILEFSKNLNRNYERWKKITG